MPARRVREESPTAYSASAPPRTFKTKAFARSARAAGISDRELCEAIAQVRKGQADDLGGGVWKKRLNENRDRSIVLAKGGRYWVYTFLFEKQNKGDLAPSELREFRTLARAFADVTESDLKALLKENRWVEICHA